MQADTSPPPSPSPSPPHQSSTAITDVDIDALAHCAKYLNLQDVSNMAMSCKFLNEVAYSDSAWKSLYRRKWPLLVPLSNQASSLRDVYLSRHTAIRQFKYEDPIQSIISFDGDAPHQLLFDKDNVIFSQGPSIYSIQADCSIFGDVLCTNIGEHNSKVTCMRLFPSSEGYQNLSDSERDDSVLITSSSDHSVRLWSKGGNRCFRGHTGSVLTLSDRLLGDDTGKIIASGSEDSTVRLWSICSSGRRGQHALKATLHGHDKPVSLISVPRHKTSLLVSAAKNGKVRVWDTTQASSSIRSSNCVGTITVPFGPVGMRCHDSLVYVAAGQSVTAVDLRSMQKEFTIPQKKKVSAFELLPTKSILCTGGPDRAILWDIRSVPEPIAELDGHNGPVKHVLMDSYKIVTGGPDDPYFKVWEASTGKHANTFNASKPQAPSGCSAMAIDRYRIVTASGTPDAETAKLIVKDFRDSICHVSSDPSQEGQSSSKFWDSGSDSEEVDCQ